MFLEWRQILVAIVSSFKREEELDFSFVTNSPKTDRVYTHTHTHTHTHTFTHIHTYTKTHTYTYKYTLIYAHSHI